MKSSPSTEYQPVKQSRSISMSVEDSLRYFDDTVAALDATQGAFADKKYASFQHEDTAIYGSESDLLSEIGYASGNTELSATSDSEEQAMETGGIRRRKSRQNRNQRLQCDPILGDLESDSTNDGQLFGSGVTVRVKTRTNSGQRRQRERRRQKRQNVSRNSWTDSGLSLSKTDSQRSSSHGENTPLRRSRSKTSPADVMDEDNSVDVQESVRSKDAEPGEKSMVQTDSGVSSPGLSLGSPVQDDCFNDKCYDESTGSTSSKEIFETSRDNCAGPKRQDASNVGKEVMPRDIFDLSTGTVEEKPVESSSMKSSLEAKERVEYSFLKPTNWLGVVNGTYSPKEKEILHQVLENARNSASVNPKAESSRGSKFPLPPHFDYRQGGEKEKGKRSGGFMKGLKKLKQGIANKKNARGQTQVTAREDIKKSKLPPQSCNDACHLPPSKTVDKKKGLLKRIFKTGGNTQSKNSSGFQRGRFGSSRSFSGSVSQLLSRGSRFRSQSVENLKNYVRRDRSSLMKRTNSSMSLSSKIPRSLSVSSLIGRRNGFARHGSVISIAGQASRPSNNGFRRADSVRSLHGGYDIATRLLESRNTPHQENYFEETQQTPLHASNFQAQFRGGWRPSSRISRKEPQSYDFSQCYDDASVIAYSDCYEDEEPCSCGCDERYYDDWAYYNENYEHSVDFYYDERNICDSRVAFADPEYSYAGSHFSRAPSVRSVNYLPSMPQSHVASYYSPANARRDTRTVVAPLNVQITQERRAERRQLTRASRSCDTFV